MADTPDTLSFGTVESLQKLLIRLRAIETPRGQAADSFEEFQLSLGPIIQPENSRNEALSKFRSSEPQIMKMLTVHADTAMIYEPDYFDAFFGVIAITSRHHQVWASLFGQKQKLGQEAQNVAQHAIEPDCVLEVARRATTLAYRVSSAALDAALRIIANCCADYDPNREVILRRQGLEALLHLVRREANLDVLIPTIYNVCADYEEAPSYPGSKFADTAVALIKPTFATEQLAAVYRSHRDFTTFELLMSLYSEISEPIRYYLASCCFFAIQPAIDGFHHVRSTDSIDRPQWDWSFKVDGKHYDTIKTLLNCHTMDEEFFDFTPGIILNLLSQQEPRNALLRREDASIWTLLTMMYRDVSEEDQSDASIAPSSPPESDREFLKLLYEITSDPEFPNNEIRASALIWCSVDELCTCVTNGENGQKLWRQRFVDGDKTNRLASACVVLSQLAVSKSTIEVLLDDRRLQDALCVLLSWEQNPHVLYPAITLPSRTAMSPRKDLCFVKNGALQNMRHLLTAKGRGLAVPLETVTAYKTIIRGRPHLLQSIIEPDETGTSVIHEMFVLWDLTIEAGTKLEVGKFLLECLRTGLSVSNMDKSSEQSTDLAVQEALQKYLVTSSKKIAEVFIWVCTGAEPVSQRDHGWFGLAMLSIWPMARDGIVTAIELSGFVSVIEKIRHTSEGPIAGNLKLLLHNVLETADGSNVSESTRGILEQAAQNMGLRPTKQ